MKAHTLASLTSPLVPFCLPVRRQAVLELFYASEDELRQDSLCFLVRSRFNHEKPQNIMRKRQKPDKKCVRELYGGGVAPLFLLL